MCPGLQIRFVDKQTKEDETWYYEDGLRAYLMDTCKDYPVLPAEPFVGAFNGQHATCDVAVFWLPEGGEAIQESYVNLIPTIQGGTHVNGLRQGLTDAMREFCEFRNLLPVSYTHLTLPTKRIV